MYVQRCVCSSKNKQKQAGLDDWRDRERLKKRETGNFKKGKRERAKRERKRDEKRQLFKELESEEKAGENLDDTKGIIREKIERGSQ